MRRGAVLLGRAPPAGLPHCTLRGGAKPMPMVGLGTFTGTRATQKARPGDMTRAVEQWLGLGGRMLDCAQNYLNEAEVGDAVASAIAGGELAREDIWITSKLNNPYHRPVHAREALEKTLLDLQVDQLDLYLIHWPVAFVHVPFVPQDLVQRGLSPEYEPDMCSKVTGVSWAEMDRSKWPPAHLDLGVTLHETWQAMVDFKKEGLCKHIGICNVHVQLLHELMCGTDVLPDVVQHESHPLLQQWGLLKYCAMNGIQFQAYSPLGYGEFLADGEPRVLEHPVLKAIAQKHGLGTTPKDLAAVCLQWCTQRGVATMPMTLKPDEMEANLQTGTLLTLDDDDFEKIRAMDKNHHFLRPEQWYGLPYWA